MITDADFSKIENECNTAYENTKKPTTSEDIEKKSKKSSKENKSTDDQDK